MLGPGSDVKGQREDAEPLSHGSQVGAISDSLAESQAHKGTCCSVGRSLKGGRTTGEDTFFWLLVCSLEFKLERLGENENPSCPCRNLPL